MALFNITRLLDVSKILATEVGQQIPEFFRYMAQVVEQTTRSLKNGITFRDNFSADVKDIELKHGIPQIVSTTQGGVTGCYPTRLLSTTHVISGFNWYYDDAGKFTVVARFAAHADSTAVTVTATDANDYSVETYQTPPSQALTVSLVILF